MGLFFPLFLIVISVITFWVFDANWINSFITEQGSSREKVLMAVDAIRWFMLLPIILGVLVLIPHPFNQKEGVSIAVQGLLGVLLLSWSFLLAFGLSSPQLIPNFSFLNGFIYVTSLHSEGHWFYDYSGIWGWFKLLWSEDVLPWWEIPFIIFGLYVGWYKSNRRLPLVLIVSWIILFLLVLGTGVSSKFAHYLIPVIPFFLLLAGLGAAYFVDILSKILPQNLAPYIQWGVVVLMVGAFATKLHLYTQHKITAYQNSDELAVGEWLSNNVKEEVFILCDKYVYIPAEPQFKHFAPWGLLPEHIEEMNPDYIIIHQRIYEHFLDSNRAEEYLSGAELYLKRNQLYLNLSEDKHPEYEMVKELDRIQVLSRKGK